MFEGLFDPLEAALGRLGSIEPSALTAILRGGIRETSGTLGLRMGSYDKPSRDEAERAAAPNEAKAARAFGLGAGLSFVTT